VKELEQMEINAANINQNAEFSIVKLTLFQMMQPEKLDPCRNEFISKA
jgi:hypothetical protein